MGASAWSCFGPYSENLALAFQFLCEKVFAEGQYYTVWLPPDQYKEETTALIREMVEEQGVGQIITLYSEWKGKPFTSIEDIINCLVSEMPPEPPKTIQELVIFNKGHGTHSVLDYVHDIDYTLLPFEQAARYLVPIPDAVLIQFFGTTRPTRSLIEEKARGCVTDILRQADNGTYTIVYENGIPSEIFVLGVSGGR